MVERDNEPSKSRLLFASVDSGRGIWTLEVRTRDHGLGSVRLGELVLNGSPDGELTGALDDVLDDSDEDDNEFGL